MTDEGRGLGRRRRGLFIAACVAIAVVAAALVATAGSDRPRQVSAATTTTAPATSPSTAAAPTSTVAPATTTSTTARLPAPTTTSTRPPERLTPESRVRFDGIGPVRVGMTPEEARKAAGVTLVQGNGPYCKSLVPSFDVVPAGYPPRSYNLIIVEGSGRVDMVEVFAAPTATVSGITVGSSADDVLRTYPGQVTDRRQGGSRGVLVLRPGDRSLGDVAVVFVVDDGEVVSYRAGRRSVVEADEACA